MFHKLKYMNAWIYTTNGETLTITCQGSREPFILKIKNQGLITLNQECRAYGEDIILNPTRDIKSKYYVNFIPQIGAGKLIFTVPDKIKDIKLPKMKINYDPSKLSNVHEMAHSLDEVQGMINDEILRQSGNETDDNTHSYLLYVTLGLFIISIMLLLFIYITYKCKLSSWAPVRQPKYDIVPLSRSKFYVETPKAEPAREIPVVEVRQANPKVEVLPPMIK